MAVGHSEETAKLDIFVVGIDDFHLAQLKALPAAHRYAFHPLFTYRELKQEAHFPVARLLREGRRLLGAFPGRVGAVVGYWDFPVGTALPILRRDLGLPGPSLEAVLRCEHKYWSRLCQAEVAQEHVPEFCLVDPFADDPLSMLTLAYPFWLKPIRSVLSFLGFRIDCEADFHNAVKRIRSDIGRFAAPFDLFFGGAHAIEIRFDGAKRIFIGAADPRRAGQAAGL